MRKINLQIERQGEKIYAFFPKFFRKIAKIEQLDEKRWIKKMYFKEFIFLYDEVFMSLPT